MPENIKINGIYECLIQSESNLKGTFRKCLVLHEYKGVYACVDIEKDTLHWTRIARDFERTEPKKGEVWRVYENGTEVDIVVEEIADDILYGKGCFNGYNYGSFMDGCNLIKLYDSVYDMIASRNENYKNTDCIGGP